MDQTQLWVDAYLEWIDVSGQEVAIAARQRSVERRTAERRSNSPSRSREDALLVALRAEADCVRMLREALEKSPGLVH